MGRETSLKGGVVDRADSGLRFDILENMVPILGDCEGSSRGALLWYLQRKGSTAHGKMDMFLSGRRDGDIQF